MQPLRLAIDFNGVIEDPDNKEKGYKMGKPIAGAVEALQELKTRGNIIVIHSIWADSEKKVQAMGEWCRYFSIPYDFITNKKPNCDVYLDNKAIRFEDWDQALRDIKATLPSQES